MTTTTGTWYPPSLGTGGFLAEIEGQLFTNPPFFMKPVYRYENCKVIRVIDGDTFVAQIDTGFKFSTIQHIRLLDCNMPERNEAGGHDATAELTAWLQDADRLIIETTKADSFGRWLAWVSRPEGAQCAAHMNEWLKRWREVQP